MIETLNSGTISGQFSGEIKTVVFDVNFEHIQHINTLFLLLTLNS